MDAADKHLQENPLSSIHMSEWREAYREFCRLKAERLSAKGKI